jgi:hypothetical protein
MLLLLSLKKEHGSDPPEVAPLLLVTENQPDQGNRDT